MDDRFLQKAETFIILEVSGLPKAEHLQFSTVPCLPKAYRNQANTSSLGIAPWNIWGTSTNALLRAFEGLGAFRSSFGRAILEAGLCSYSRSVSGRRGGGIAAV